MAESNIRTVCIELQRPGPPHNLLLSPLTRYLGSTTEAETGEVSVREEHAQMLRKLRGLRVTPDPNDAAMNAERQLALMELSREMSQLLASIPGLQGQLVSRGCKNELIHLQVITSAAELAMLPFELAGTVESRGEYAGSYLTLAARPRVTLTRRVKSVSENCIKWPIHPRILFVSASPKWGVPYDDHLDALIRALQPWLPRLTKGETSKHRERYNEALKQQLTVLEHADIDQVVRACAQADDDEKPFTHVHVLAHGALDPTSPGKHVGIMLHHPSDGRQPHVVSGEQFASALRRDRGRGGPCVVSVAACDGGYINEVMYTGSNFLHDVHRSGVPFVIGSQFPLSKPGSVDMCEKLYTGLLLGEDPRELLANLRIRLHSRYAERNHDWASLVVYAVFPNDFDRQLEELQYWRGRLATNVALSLFDQAVEAAPGDPSRSVPDSQQPSTEGEHSEGGEDDKPKLPAQVDATVINEILDRVKDASARVPTEGRFRVEGLALKSVHQKRLAYGFFRMNELRDSVAFLRQARVDYIRAFEQGAHFQGDEALSVAPLHWPLAQEVSLTLALGLQNEDHVHDRIATARILAEQDIDSGTREAEKWAITTLLELSLLLAWLSTNAREEANHIDSMIAWTKRLLNSRSNADAVHSTQFQLRRYTEWWWEPRFVASLGASEPLKPSDTLRSAVNTIVAQMHQYLDVNQTSIARRR